MSSSLASSYKSKSNNSSYPLNVTVLSNVNSSPNLKATSHKKENLYVKKGAKRKKGTLMKETLGAVKPLASQPISQSSSTEYFGNFIGARLREMSPLSRRRCEHEILNCLANY